MSDFWVFHTFPSNTPALCFLFYVAALRKVSTRYMRKPHNLLRNHSFSILNANIFYDPSHCGISKTKQFIISKFKKKTQLYDQIIKKKSEQWFDPVSLVCDWISQERLFHCFNDSKTRYYKTRHRDPERRNWIKNHEASCYLKPHFYTAVPITCGSSSSYNLWYSTDWEDVTPL